MDTQPDFRELLALFNAHLVNDWMWVWRLRQTMSKAKRALPAAKSDVLFDRVVSILDQARGNVVRAVHTNMVLAKSRKLSPAGRELERVPISYP